MATKLETLVPWSPIKRTETRNGPRILRTAAASPAFWDAWKTDKTAMKAAGISVSKEAEGWRVCWWQPIEQQQIQLVTQTALSRGTPVTNLLDAVIENTQASARIISQDHNLGNINWVAGLTDPGEMISCGYLPEIRRRAGEQDTEYAARIRPIVMALPEKDRNKIMSAAVGRASLDTSNGRISVMSAGQLPWHGLGVVVDKATSSAEAIRFAGLDWEVEKLAMAYTFRGQQMPAPDAFAIVRKDTGKHLGTVGRIYEPFQNRDGFAFLDGVLSEYDARYETAGSIYGGKKIWMLAHLPNAAFKVNGEDCIEPYVLFTNCHDGSGAAHAYPTSVRVVCANTFRTAGRDQGRGISIRHTGSLKAKVESAKTALGVAAKSFNEFKVSAERMATVKMDMKAFADDLLDAVLEVTKVDAAKGADALVDRAIAVTQIEFDLAAKKIQRQIDRRVEITEDILTRYEGQKNSIGGMRGSAWAAFNAATEYADHSDYRRYTGDDKASRRMESLVAGDADQLKQVAYQLATAAR